MKHVWFHSILFCAFSPRNPALLSHYTKWNNITPKSLVSFSKYNNNKYHTSSHFNRSHCNKCSRFSIFSTFPDFQQSLFKDSFTILRNYTIFCHLHWKQVFKWWLTQRQMETCPLKIWLIHLRYWSTICNLLLTEHPQQHDTFQTFGKLPTVAYTNIKMQMVFTWFSFRSKTIFSACWTFFPCTERVILTIITTNKQNKAFTMWDSKEEIITEKSLRGRIKDSILGPDIFIKHLID